MIPNRKNPRENVPFSDGPNNDTLLHPERGERVVQVRLRAQLFADSVVFGSPRFPRLCAGLATRILADYSGCVRVSRPAYSQAHLVCISPCGT